MKMQVGHFEPDGALIYLPLGFVPSLFMMLELGGGDAAVKQYWWLQMMEDDEASGSKEGVSVLEGITATLADSAGLAAYSTGSQGPTITEWAATTAYTARTATAHGSYVKGTTAGVDKNGLTVDREAVFECVTAGTSGSTQPTWPSQIGANSASDNGVIWQKISTAAIKRIGYDGVRIAAALMTDGQEMYYAAWLCDEVDHGDVVGWTGGIYGS